MGFLNSESIVQRDEQPSSKQRIGIGQYGRSWDTPGDHANNNTVEA